MFHAGTIVQHRARPEWGDDLIFVYIQLVESRDKLFAAGRRDVLVDAKTNIIRGNYSET